MKKYNLQQLQALYEDFKPEAILDFHDFGPIDKAQIEIYYDKFIEESINFYQINLLIITGKGEVVRPTIRRLLAKDKRIERFSKAGYFQGQDGAFEVTLLNEKTK